MIASFRIEQRVIAERNCFLEKNALAIFCNHFLFNRFFMVRIANSMDATVYFPLIVKMSAHDVSMT